MNIKEEYQRLASESMNNDNFAHFMTIAKKFLNIILKVKSKMLNKQR